MFRAVADMHRIVEILFITSKAERSLGVPCSRGLFKVAEGDAWMVLDVIRVRACHRKRGAKIHCLRSKDGDWDRVLGGRDLDETQQLGTPYGPTGGASPEVFC